MSIRKAKKQLKKLLKLAKEFNAQKIVIDYSNPKEFITLIKK